jgi:hypothetical protein
MKGLRLFSIIRLAGFLFLGCLISWWAKGCSGKQDISGPEIFPSSQIPQYVRQIKYLRVPAISEKTDTTIDLHRGELFTIMAIGEISLLPHGRSIMLPDPCFVKWINDVNFGPVFSYETGGSYVSQKSGRLYLGIMDNNHGDNRGGFDAIIVVWNTTDYGKMADFLEALKLNAPNHSGIADAYSEAIRYEFISFGRSQIPEEIEDTKNQIRQLEQDKSQPSATPATAREQRLIELENRLAELKIRLSRVDMMTGQIKQEKEKTAQLSLEIEKKDQVEKQLIKKISDSAAVPPVMLIISPEEGDRNPTGRTRLSGVVEDDKGIKQIEIFLNGQRMPSARVPSLESSKGTYSRRLSFEENLELRPGENSILVAVTDIEGISVEKKLVVHHVPFQQNVMAVVVGINDYLRFPKLKYAVSDAEAFYHWLVEVYRIPPENVILLTNTQASLRSLRNHLGTRLKSSANREDTVFIYFAGHGATERDAESPDGDGLEKYLIAHDTDPADLYSTALPMREIGYLFKRIRSERLIFIADSCYSGASGGRTVGISSMRANISEAFLDRVVSGRGKVIMTASGANEVSVEKDELQHGVFTYYLLEGLKGRADVDGDKMISLEEAYRYVSVQVPLATGQEQHPAKKGSVEGSLIIGIVR